MQNTATADIATKNSKLQELEDLSTGAGFWDDAASAQKTMAEISSLKKLIERVEGWGLSLEEVQEYLDLAQVVLHDSQRRLYEGARSRDRDKPGINLS